MRPHDSARHRRPPPPPAEPEPCLLPSCDCCAAWTVALELLREHTRRHLAGEMRVAPCFPECLICAEIGWQGTAALGPDDVAGPGPAAADVALRARAVALGIDPDAYLDPVAEAERRQAEDGA